MVILGRAVQWKPGRKGSECLMEEKWVFNNEVTARSSISDRKLMLKMA